MSSSLCMCDSPCLQGLSLAFCIEEFFVFEDPQLKYHLVKGQNHQDMTYYWDLTLHNYGSWLVGETAFGKLSYLPSGSWKGTMGNKDEMEPEWDLQGSSGT